MEGKRSVLLVSLMGCDAVIYGGIFKYTFLIIEART